MSFRQRFFMLNVAVLLLLAVLMPLDNSKAGTFVVFGPEDYSRDVGKPETVTAPFSVYNPNTTFTIHIYNGGKSGEFDKVVASAVIEVNDVVIFEPVDFNHNVDYIERPVVLEKDNVLSVELRSSPGSGLTIEIIGVDNEPPTISAIVTPPPNEHGWNNSDVTVEFVCSDVISGVSFCSDPILVQTEGADQVFSGTAIDYAGNEATTSVTINLDKTPPQITATKPAPNEYGWYNTDVPVEFACSDNLSGISSCPGTVLVQTEGADQVISGTAVDLAGNQASTSTTVSLDKTPPQITAVTTPAHPVFDLDWYSTDVTVDFVCEDNLSGIASFPSSVLLQTEGAGQVVSGTTVDRAGNEASASKTINIDKTPPTVTITNPLPNETVSTTPVDLKAELFDQLSGIFLYEITLNGSIDTYPGSSEIDQPIPLVEGENSVAVKAFDYAGNVNSASVGVTYAVIPFALIKKFAPQLRFSTDHWSDWWSPPNFPMSAQDYYDTIVAQGNPERIYFNGNWSTIAADTVPTYWSASVCNKQVRIIYAWFYGYQFPGDGASGYHNGDWEHIMVTLSENREEVAAVTYWQHKGWYTRIRGVAGLPLYEDTHPIVYPGRTQHGSYHYTQTDFQTLCYWDDHRDGKGGTWNTWADNGRCLVQLARQVGDGEPWMDHDLTEEFRWGWDDGCSTHPTRSYIPGCYCASCYGHPFNLCTIGQAGGCGRSQCQVGDSDDGITCWHCAPRWINYGLYCVEDCGWWIFCDHHWIACYSISYPLPTGDAGLLYKNPTWLSGPCLW